jgi:hypothetical protein
MVRPPSWSVRRLVRQSSWSVYQHEIIPVNNFISTSETEQRFDIRGLAPHDARRVGV